MSSPLPEDDSSLFAAIRAELATAQLGDILDTLGYTHQFLPPGISPLNPSAKLIGRAMTVQETDSLSSPQSQLHAQGPLAKKPFGLMMEALDSLQENEIYIATCGPLPGAYALWGGLMSTRAQTCKAAGAILDGYVRDASEIEALGFTVFSRGLYAQDQGVRGKVVDYRCPIEIGKVRVETGDLVFADREGVLIVPRRVEREAIAKALEKARTESEVAVAIKRGMSAGEAFERFGVL
jgi:4-hydroxy-4-methyl-2-oxoglutarate aldolase